MSEITVAYREKWLIVGWLDEWVLDLRNDQRLQLLALRLEAEGVRVLPDDYVEYMNSEEWHKKRKGAIESTGGCCEVCSDEAELHVHHRNYENWRNEGTADLVVLCQWCHWYVHPYGKMTREAAEQEGILEVEEADIIPGSGKAEFGRMLKKLAGDVIKEKEEIELLDARLVVFEERVAKLEGSHE